MLSVNKFYKINKYCNLNGITVYSYFNTVASLLKIYSVKKILTNLKIDFFYSYAWLRPLMASAQKFLQKEILVEVMGQVFVEFLSN